MSRYAQRRTFLICVITLCFAACSANPPSPGATGGGSPSALPSPTPTTIASPTSALTALPTVSVSPTATVAVTAQPTAVPTPAANATESPTAAPTATAPPAASERRPDGQIRLRDLRYKYPDSNTWETQSENSPWLGNDIYNATGKNQTVKGSYYATTPAEVTAWRFSISIENDGDAPDRFRLQASGPALPDGYCFESTCYKWKLDWFRDVTKITAAIDDGTYKTAQLAPGDSEVIV